MARLGRGFPSTNRLSWAIILSANQIATPGVGQLIITGFAPTVSISGNQSAAPGTGDLTLTGFAPTATTSNNQSATPGVGSLVITGFAPAVVIAPIGGPAVATPGTGQLILTGFAPIPSNGGATGANHGRTNRRRAWVY